MCVCVSLSVYVLYVLLVFQGMWVFYIYFGVIGFFFCGESKEVDLTE